MADAAFKPDKDFSKEVDKQLPEAEQLAKVLSFCLDMIADSTLTSSSDRPESCHREALPP